MKVKEAMQAFPFIEPANDEAVKAYHPGLSLRTYIAIEVMKALLSNPDCELDPIREVVPASFKIADAMIQESQC
jgi:hypothetical protein